MEDKKMSEVEEVKKVNPWIIVVSIVAILQLIVLGAIFKDPLIEMFSQISPEEVEVIYYPLDGLHVNLADANEKHYLKTNVSLQFETTENLELIEKNAIQIKATVIETLRSKTLSEINTVELTKKLQQDLLNEINLMFEDVIVTDVYFTDFLYQ